MATHKEIYNRHLNILVIEDNPGDAKLVELFLQSMDVIADKVTVCPTMGQALELLATQVNFDAIISDLTLPDTQGMQTVESLISAHPEKTIIIQTGVNDKEIGLAAVKAGAQDFLVKGYYQPDELAKTVRFAIERRNILERLEETQKLAHIGHFELDAQSGRINCSAEYCRMLDLGDKANSYLLSDLIVQKPFLKEIFSIERCTDEQGYISSDVSIEFPDRAKKWLAINCKSNSDSGMITGLLQDITARKEGEEIKRQHEMSQQAVTMKEQFIASVSHEMRTPMNAILGLSNLLLDHTLDEVQRNYIRSIKQSSEILLGIVNDILTISTLQNGQVHLERHTFDIQELLANILNIISYKIQEKGLMFDLRIDERISGKLVGDKLRLNQILINLIGNAIKFTDEGGVEVHVYILKETANGIWLEFKVCDSGIGIPADKIDAIFESFTRVKYKDRLFEGTGLGLSISKRLITQQGGTISATSETGKGSVFTITLPFEYATEGDQDPDQVDDQLLFDTNTSFRLLLAEDNRLNQIVAIKTIERQYPNAQIDLAVNGEEAIALLLKNDYALVLMDLQMPVMDGNEAVKYIREKTPLEKRKVFIFAMTAHAHVGEAGQVEGMLMDDFVLKPFEPEQLYSKISKYVRLSLDGQTSIYGA